ncbi:hypothetical protein D6779_02460 [Candidatus Parcubacteria bacterium]|nr:MAG: hypothetical protein D6779_02460 [Candidatus Parcubacteria bacterium]
MFATRFICRRDIISIFELGASEEERIFAVEIQKHPLGIVCLPSWAVPSVALLGKHVAVWAGTNLYLFSEKDEPRRLQMDEEVDAVYEVGPSICIVGELSIRIFDGNLHEVDRYEADDVLGRSWWEGDCLLVELENATLKFSVSPNHLRKLNTLESDSFS